MGRDLISLKDVSSGAVADDMLFDAPSTVVACLVVGSLTIVEALPAFEGSSMISALSSLDASSILIACLMSEASIAVAFSMLGAYFKMDDFTIVAFSLVVDAPLMLGAS